MIWKHVNPYDAPQSADVTRAVDSEKLDDHQRRLSNRVMALAIGITAFLFIMVGCSFWAETLRGVSVPAGNLKAFTIVTIVAGFTLPTIGLAMMGVAVFLWRYGRNGDS